jgi:NRPS condensation-like uncharacterized protein
MSSASDPEGVAAPLPAQSRSAPAVRITLNAFQLLMRRWSKMHPYNAGQVMEVSGAADVERWRQAVRGVLAEMRLGTPRFEKGDQVAVFAETPAEATIEETTEGLAAFFCGELNRSFADGDSPIRFCLLPKSNSSAAAQESHYFAAVYDHWIADSRAMRELMQRIFTRYRHPGGTPQLPALTLDAPRFKSRFRHHVGMLTRCTALRESMRNVWRHRQGFRVNIRDPLDFESHLLVRQLPEGLIEQVHRYAKSRHASVNDLFIAVLSQTMGTFTHSERARRRKRRMHFPRTRIGIGTIVDIRDAASEPLDRVFNLYLSSYTVVLNDPENRPLDAVLSETAETTSALKKSFATVKAFWAMATARMFWDYSSSARYRSLMLHKMVPVVAGISNVNLTGTWADVDSEKGHEEGPQVLDYFRISPTGPLLPLVFTLTTIGKRLSLCVTYRTTAFRDLEAKGLAEDFVRRLQSIVG